MTAQLTTCHTSSTHCVASWNNVVLVDIAAELSAQDIRAFAGIYESVLARYPNGIAVLSVMRSKVSVARSDRQGEGNRILSELGDKLLQLVFVIESRGVVSQLIRTVVRGMKVITRNTQISVAETIEDAVHMLAPYAVTQGDRKQVESDLAQAISFVRAQYSQTLPRTSLY